MISEQEIVICSPVRTAIGTYNGAFKDLPTVELGAAVVRESMRRSGLLPDQVDSVILGNVIQAGNRMNPARQAAIGGGVPVGSPAMTVNRVCGSGAQAIASAAQEIALGFSEVVIAGGMENMDRAPYLLANGRWGYRMGDAQIIDSMLHDGLNDAFSGEHSGWHTEDLVRERGITRERQDKWAERSQQRFAAAMEAKLFDDEIVGVEVKTRKGMHMVTTDEHPRPETTFEGLAKLKPAFRADGTITAGNAPGLNSGASAMIVSHRRFAEDNGMTIAARLISFAVSAVEPDMFGIAPVSAVAQALERARWTLRDVQRFEINEAFAAVPLVVIDAMSLPDDIVNVEGGVIAHGHPIGATGAVLITRLIHSMKRDGLKRGIVTLCIGGGQGIALALEIA